MDFDLKDVLNRGNLEKLLRGELDVPAAQIYYFEKKNELGEFYFEHYYRNGSGWDCNFFSDYDINEFDQEIEIDRYDDCSEAFDAYINRFANMYKMHCDGYPDTLVNEVFNGEESIAQLREAFEPIFEEVWNRKRMEIFDKEQKELEEERNRLYSMIEKYPQIQKLPCFQDKLSFDRTFQFFSDVSTLHIVFDIVKDLAIEIEKRDLYIEQYQEENKRLNALVLLERAKQKIAEKEIKE